MRNPAVHLVGIAASPRGGEIFGSRAEEELRQWLEARLDELGIDPVAYSRFVLSLLRCTDSALSSPEEAFETGGGTGRRIRPKAALLTNDDRPRRAVVQCLTNVADNEYGVEILVDELCLKLKDLEGATLNDENQESKQANDESNSKTNLEALTPRDRALKYYAAFPALQSVSMKKFSPRKERNFANYYNNKNSGINLHNNKNNKARSKKSKMSLIKSPKPEDKDSFGFAKSVESEREKERELEMDELKLAQLKAKFNESLKALWGPVPGSAQDKASIWASSGSLWPTDTTKTIFTLPTSENSNAASTPYQELIADEPQFIPWNILMSIEDCTDECSNKSKTEYNMNWAASFVDGPVYGWKPIDNNLVILNHSPDTASFVPVTPCITPLGTRPESRSSMKVNSLPEPDEDLLTSARTHFRPIKDDGRWADGTTFPVNNAVEQVAYRRSESGCVFYLPGEESPYMEYRENDAAAPRGYKDLTLKFRVRQCDKSIQTDFLRPPAKRRLVFEDDHSSVGVGEAVTQTDDENIEKDFIPLDDSVQSDVPLHNDRKR